MTLSLYFSENDTKIRLLTQAGQVWNAAGARMDAEG